LPSLPIAASASSVTKFSVISFNILCPEFAFPHQYRYCPQWALNADFRAKKVFTQLQQEAADIVCLQELDQFEELWKPAMAQLGYQGFYKKRTGNQTDGVAIFFLSSKYERMC
jgi:mRNA deadenylase 3'-5' endonuclease subunit Ccr4